MITQLVRFSLVQRLMILLFALALTAAGLWAFNNLAIDAFPDISSPQVQVIVKAPGMSPSEVENRITFPIELEMQGRKQYRCQYYCKMRAFKPTAKQLLQYPAEEEFLSESWNNGYHQDIN